MSTFGALCSGYSRASKAYQDAGWDDWPFRVDVYLADAVGQKSENIYSYLPTGAIKRIGGYSPVINFPGYTEYSNLILKLNSNLNKQIIIECTYGDYITGRVQTLGAMIPVNQMDSRLIVISPFTEIVLRTKQIAAQRGTSLAVAESTAIASIESRFPFSAVRLQPYPVNGYDGVVLQFNGSNSAFMAAAQGLFEHAYPNFRENITAYARQAAAAVFGDCTVIEFCIVYSPGRTQTVSRNPEFANGSLGWSQLKNVVPRQLGSISITTEGIDSRAILELSPNDTRDTGRSRLEIAQRFELNGQALDTFLFNATASNIKAGATWINNFAASGLAGVFLCFESGTTTLGCYLAGYHFDAITLPIKVGEAFKIQSTSSFNYDFISDRGFVRYRSLKSIAEGIPSVSSQSNRITAVTIGAIAGEAAIVDQCYLCFARVEVDRVSIEQLK